MADINHLKGKIDTVGMPMPDEFAKESFPHLVGLLKNTKENNGKKLETPLWRDDKYKPKIDKAFGAWMKATEDYEKRIQISKSDDQVDVKIDYKYERYDYVASEDYVCACASIRGYDMNMVGGFVAIVQWTTGTKEKTVQYNLCGLKASTKFALTVKETGNITIGVKSAGSNYISQFYAFSSDENGYAKGKETLNSKYNIETQFWFGRALCVLEEHDSKYDKVVALGTLRFELIAP